MYYMHFLVWDVRGRDIWQMLMHIPLLQRIVADMSPEQNGKKTVHQVICDKMCDNICDTIYARSSDVLLNMFCL